ncbi:hypothetical protein E4U54_000129 [Claviceps lovelessii]|nr:hypothetical protein E4U54_000129 [Claviceps lovelessii]
MDIESPIRYPPRIFIHDTDTDTDTDSSFQASDDSTIADGDSPPQSSRPRLHLVYGDEAGLPLYQKDVDTLDAKARRAVKKTLCIRLMASIFVAILVSVTVAAAVARIYDSEMHPSQSSNQTLDENDGNNTHRWNKTSFTISSSHNKSTPTLLPRALQSWKTVGLEQPTPTAYETSARTTVGAGSARVVDCSSAGLFAHASLVTDVMPTATDTPSSNCRRCKRHQQSTVAERPDGEDDKMVGMSMYAFGGCLLTRYACKSPDVPEDIVFKCAVLCLGKNKLETNQARHAMTEEWGACG